MNNATNRTLRFSPGSVYITPGAIAALAEAGQRPETFLARHLVGDWGEVNAEDQAANERALVEGTRLLSAYMTTLSERIWLITEWDRSATTILLPCEY